MLPLGLTALLLTAPITWHSGERSLFVGDSITLKAVLTVPFFQALVQRHPDLAIDSGWQIGSAGFTCAQLKTFWPTETIGYGTPDVLYLECGMNDTHLQPWSQANEDAYATSLTALVAYAQGLYPAADIVVLSGMPVDPVTYAGPPTHLTDASTMNTTIGRFFTRFQSLCSAHSWNCVDMYTPILTAMNVRAAMVPPPTWTIGSVGDGVHPQAWSGGAVYAEALLVGLGETSSVSSAHFDALDGGYAACTRCAVSNLSVSPTSAAFDKLDTTVPQQWSNVLSPSPGLAVGVIQNNAFISRNAAGIQVANLTPGTYSITIDSSAFPTHFTDAQLAAGVDVQSSLAWHTPSETITSCERKVNSTLGPRQTFIAPWQPSAGLLWTPAEITDYIQFGQAAALSHIDDKLRLPNGCAAAANAAAVPVSHHYVVTRIGP